MFPGEWWAQVLALGVIVVAAWIALQPRCAFVIQISQGLPKATSGKVTAAFLEQVREVCQQNSVQHGRIRGLIRGRRIVLGFSASVPPAGQQRLRNWWANWGWSAKPMWAP
jgi:Protein of unknown function (DUF3634)